MEELKNVDTKYEFDTVICLDCGDIERIGAVRKYIKENTMLVNIDHHISNTNFGKVNYVDKNISSASEITYQMIKEMGIVIDKDIAEALYVGILTDTGSFAHENVSSETFWQHMN